MNGKGRKAKNQANINNSMNVFSQEELGRRIAAVEADMKSSTWKDLEVGGKFDKNAKLTFITDDMLILGCDIGSETHYVRAIDTRGRGYSRAEHIVKFASESVGLKHGTGGSKEAVRCFVEEILYLTEKLDEIEESLHQKCREIPYAENLLEIEGVGENILAGILAEMGDVSRFDDVKEIQKLSGLGLVACSSGKHKGETKISHRGRKRLRYWLFQAARSAVSHAEEFKTLHVYYTTRPDNPLKKMQSLIVIACKILRVIFAILRTGQKYDPAKMLRDIKRPCGASGQAA